MSSKQQNNIFTPLIGLYNYGYIEWVGCSNLICVFIFTDHWYHRIFHLCSPLIPLCNNYCCNEEVHNMVAGRQRKHFSMKTNQFASCRNKLFTFAIPSWGSQIWGIGVLFADISAPRPDFSNPIATRWLRIAATWWAANKGGVAGCVMYTMTDQLISTFPAYSLHHSLQSCCRQQTTTTTRENKLYPEVVSNWKQPGHNLYTACIQSLCPKIVYSLFPSSWNVSQRVSKLWVLDTGSDSLYTSYTAWKQV